MDQLPRIFIAYARKDAALLEELRIHLHPLERTKRAIIWYDGNIEPGAVWEDAIKENLHAADLILLLVSADAIASDYFYEKEMADALERHERGEARVVPLIIKPCAWKATPLARLQALPKDAKPVSSWNDRDEAWNDAVEAVLVLIEERDMKILREKEAEEKQRREGEEAEEKRRREEVVRREKEVEETIQTEEAKRHLLDPFHGLMIPIKGGVFQMGDEHTDLGDLCTPVHEVMLNDFYLCKHPVTQAQWRTIMGADPLNLYFKGCDDCPVEGVSWNDVQEFVKKLNKKTGRHYRLPTEAEWEYAARGGRASNKTKYAGSDKIEEVAWYKGNSGGRTQPVMQKKANELGLYDMGGNVSERCEDVWNKNYQGAPTDGSALMTGIDQSIHVLRGGSIKSGAEICGVALRSGDLTFASASCIGFRLAHPLPLSPLNLYERVKGDGDR
ncbi:MAG: SUMF1/EgtB/PvdO family nonheme iron enzyme [Saprospiraceae bacterium]